MKKNKIENPTNSDSVIIPQINRISDFMQFVQWFATPQESREFKTQKDFANAIGISPDTLTDWKKLPEFWTILRQNINQGMLEKIPDVINGLILKASNEGSAKEVELCLRLAGILINKDKK